MRTRIAPTQRAAMSIALRAGALRQCFKHWVYYRSSKPDVMDHAYRLGNYLISHYAKSVACFKGDRRLMADAVNRCMEDAPVTCQLCAMEHEQQ